MKIKFIHEIDQNELLIRKNQQLADFTFLNDEQKNCFWLNFSWKKDLEKSFEIEQCRKIVLPFKKIIQIDLKTFDLPHDLENLHEVIFKNYEKKYSLKQTAIQSENWEIHYLIDQKDLMLQSLIEDSFNKFQAIELGKYLSDTNPSTDGTPEAIALAISKIFHQRKNVKVKVWGLNEIKKAKLTLLEKVSQGSIREPRFVVIEYFGGSTKIPPIALVGKGVTFDSGGYSLKDSDSMKTMRLDKCGACDLVGILDYLSQTQKKVNVIAFLPLTENALGQGSTYPGEIVATRKGFSVQIDNTDAEGRLILADAITFAIEEYNPCEIIELSTLTGAITISLGKYLTGCFTNDLKWAEQFKADADEVGDDVWILPIHRKNFEALRAAELADITNSPLKSKHGGSSQGAAFLSLFANPIRFIHLDIGGTAVEDNRATGAMIKGIINYLSKKK